MLIEFERRLMLMNPELASSEKIDSDTIFSFLYAYTLRFVLANLISADKTEDGTRVLKYDTGLLSSLITKVPLKKYIKDVSHSEENTLRYLLPKDYLAFIRCTCSVQQVYKSSTGTRIPSDVPVKLIKQEEVDQVLSTIHNTAILPYPYAVLHTNTILAIGIKVEYKPIDDNGNLELYTDKYTTVYDTVLTYCRKPKKFNVIGVDNEEVLNHCELPESVHMSIVEGAVEMFITEAKYRLSANSKKLEDKE